MKRTLGWIVTLLACVHVGLGLGVLPYSVSGGIALITCGVIMMALVLRHSNHRLLDTLKQAIPPRATLPRRDWLWVRSAAVAIIAGGIAFGELLHEEPPPFWAFLVAASSASWMAVVFLRELHLINREQDLRRARLRELRRRYGSSDRPL